MARFNLLLYHEEHMMGDRETQRLFRSAVTYLEGARECLQALAQHQRQAG